MPEGRLSPIPSSTPIERLRDRCFLGAALLITAITYIKTLGFGFVYDDSGQIVGNPFLRSWRYIPKFFVTPLWVHQLPAATGNYYRPLFLLWSLINYSVFKDRPFGWHMEAVVLHLIVTWLVYRVVGKMTGRNMLAWMTALLFGVHPVHHEVVAWISGATESLFAIFFLAAFLAYLKSRESSPGLWVAISCLLYGLALLSKETAIVLPVLVLAHAWISERVAGRGGWRGLTDRIRRHLRLGAAYVPVAVIYLFARSWALSGLGHPGGEGSGFTIWWTLPSVLLFYVQHWVFPVRLAEFYDLFAQRGPNVSHVLLPGVTLLGVGISIWVARRWLGARETGFAAAWILIPLLPALGLAVFRPDELVHDRYFYVPSLGAALLTALIIEEFGKGKATLFDQPARTILVCLGLAGLFSVGSMHAANFWKNDFSLFSRACEIAPKNVTAQNDLSVEWILRGDMDRAQGLMERVLQEHPDDGTALSNLSRVQYMKQDYAAAESSLRHAIQLTPSNPDAYVTLSQLDLKIKRPAEALLNARRAVELNPYESRYHTIYGLVLEQSGDCAGARDQFQSALSLNPSDVYAQRGAQACSPSDNAGSASGSVPSPRVAANQRTQAP
jgi:Tfp pilus assembly protein PilF